MTNITNLLCVFTLLVLTNTVKSSSSSQGKLNVSLYYESLCPFCRLFDENQIYPTYQKLGQYFNLDLVPYGNAQRQKVGDQWIFKCQHGKKECYGNKIQACVLSSNITYDEKIKFVACIMGSDDPALPKWGEQCAKQLSLNWSEISICAGGKEGDNLLAYYGEKTDALVPKHSYVPWLVFNGNHNETVNMAALQNFAKVVCSLLDNKPENCTSEDNNV